MAGGIFWWGVRALAAALAVAGYSAAHADPTYPSKPITLIVPFAPGGSSDGLSRLLSEPLSKKLGQPIVIENRPGASGNIGAEALARSRPDGYTLMLVNDGVFTINPSVYSKLAFDFRRDFVFIAKIGDYPCVLAAKSTLPAKSVADMVAASKTVSKGFDLGVPGAGTPEQLIAADLVGKTGANITVIPYKGGGPAMTDLIAGHIDLGLTSVGSGASLIKSGRIRPLAVSSTTRWPSLPDVPTLSESGAKDVSLMQFIGIYAPAGSPPDIVARVNAAVREVVADTEIVDRAMSTLGVRIASGTPEEFRKEIMDTYERYVPIIKSLGVKAD